AILRGGSRIGLALGRTPAMKLQLGKDMVGRGCAVVRFELVMLVHGMLRRQDRDPRGLHGDEARGRAGPAPGAKRKGRSDSGGWRIPAILPRDGKARSAAGK